MSDIDYSNIETVYSADLQTQLDALQAIAKNYLCLYVIDVATDTMQEIYAPADVSNYCKQFPSASTAIWNFGPTFATEPYQEGGKEWLDWNNILERLKESNVSSYEYYSNFRSWCRAMFWAMEKDDEGNVTKFIFSNQIIDEDKKRELQHIEEVRAAAREASRIVSALSREYKNVFLLDRDTQTFSIQKLESITMEDLGIVESDAISYAEFVREYAARRVHPSIADTFVKMMAFDKVAVEVDLHGEYEYSYRIRAHGKTHNFLVKFVDMPASAEIIIGFRNIDSLIAEELEKRRRMRAILQGELDERTKITNALGREYVNIYTIDVASATGRIIKEDRFRVGDALDQDPSDTRFPWNSATEVYAKTSVSDDDRDIFLEAVSFETILAELRDKDEYTKSFRGLRNGIVSNYQFKFIRLDEDTIVASFRNIDSIVHAETQVKLLEKANKAKTVFLNNMSHDIRTPMNAIIGFTALASAHVDEKDKVLDYLQKIQTSSNHLLSLINDVLDMSRIESGKVKIEEAPLSIPEVMHDIRSIVQVDIKRKQLELSFDTADVKDENVICDKLRLNQVLLNCLSNAIKFTPAHGAIDVKVVQVPCDKEGFATYRFHVKDTGIGMSKEFAAHIFEPFTREETSTVSGIQGTGLGMAITKNIVDMMDGTITVESEKDKGTEFIIEFTLRTVEGSTDRDQRVPALGTAEGFERLDGIRILLVEDNPLNKEIALELLGERGAVLDTAADGAEAVEIMKQAQPDQYDVILMDIQMPIMNGYEASTQIRALDDKQKAAIPIVALTADAFVEDRKRADDAGMNAHAAKPIDLPELIATIHSVLP